MARLKAGNGNSVDFMLVLSICFIVTLLASLACLFDCLAILLALLLIFIS